MKSEVRKKMLVHAALITGVSLAGILMAQVFNKLVPISQAAVTEPPMVRFSRETAAPGRGRLSQRHQQVFQWFTGYDAIRHQAQMTPQEKLASTKLLAEAMTGGSDQDKAEGKALLTKMADRYKRAADQLQSLSRVPQTAELQDGYQQYFTTGSAFFSKYLAALDETQQHGATDSLRSDRMHMATLDMSNKSLDRKLRQRYGIQPYRW